MKILFISNTDAPWIKTDIKILEENNIVTKINIAHNTIFFNTIKSIKKVYTHDILYLWFGSLSFLPLALIAKVLSKKVIIIAGGYDVAKVGKIKHGYYDKTFVHITLSRILFTLADRVFAVSDFTKKEVLQNTKCNRSKVSTIKLGYDEIEIKKELLKQKIITQISSVPDLPRYKLKGIDQFIELAKSLPDFQFYLIGNISKTIKLKINSQKPHNLFLVGFLDNNSPDFRSILEKSLFISQLSYYESFGSALVEGLLHGCFPLVYNRAALQEVSSLFKYEISYPRISELTKFIRSNPQLNYTPSDIRSIAIKEYPVTKRALLINHQIAKM